MENRAELRADTLYLSGELTFSSIQYFSKEIDKLIRENQPLSIDLSGLAVIDSAGVAFLESLESVLLPAADKQLFQNIPHYILSVMDTFSGKDVRTVKTTVKKSLLEQIGESFYVRLQDFVLSLVMAADVFYWAGKGLVSLRGQRKGAFLQQCYLLGAQAFPIVALLSFIIGFILSLQSGAQLRLLGANVFLADLMTISMVREMGPMMTAIIVAGRSGSAITSEIASMQVSEEIDALRMMAINPIRYVVVPKFHAISLMMPLLVTFSILIGMSGALLIAVGYLEMSPDNFLNRCLSVLYIKDIIVTMIKSIFFSWVIVIIGSHFGFTVKGGAEGVGKATTNSVVVSIFAVIFFDAVFSLLYLK